MGEAEWLACERPSAMLDFLRDHGERDRKLLLFSAACCRLDMQDAPATFQERHRRAIETIERHADGLATAKQMRQACGEIPYRPCPPSRLVLEVGRFSGGVGARLAAHALAKGGNLSPLACRLLRDVFGNPFHPVVLDPGLRTRIVLALVRTIYDERTFDHLPILADALEEAGCTNPDILDHLRSPGPHVRGCWPLDSLLGKS